MVSGRRATTDARISGILGWPSSTAKPGPTRALNIQMARQKAASRHLFRCEVVAAVSARGPGRPWLGGSRDPVLSDTELGSFMGLPNEADMAAVPLEPGRMGARSGGDRVDAPDATTIDIERPDG